MSSDAKKTAADTGMMSGSGGCPVDRAKRGTATQGCPVKKHSDLPLNQHPDKHYPFGLPPSIEQAANHPQSPHPDQTIPLSTKRAVSSIPRADELRPEEEGKTAPHQPKDNPKWIYPSEQQFYNAMRRKGWQGVDEQTIPAVVRIHNAVNERGWTQVKQWERELHGCDNPRLVHFLGRPNDLSPRAWAHTYLLGNRPFDRHDWFVDRRDGKEPRRYVIDFYSDEKEGKENGASGMHLDVRPALDSPEACADRVMMFLRDAFPGIYGLLQRTSGSPSDSVSRTDSKSNPDGQ